MSKLVEAVLKIPMEDVYALGWQPYRQEKLTSLLEQVPLESIDFKDVTDSRLMATMRQEFEELGYRDKEFVGGDSFIRVELTNGDMTFSLLANRDSNKIYDVEVTFFKSADHLEEEFFDKNIKEYYKLLTYFASKFLKLRHVLLCTHPTYIARRSDDSEVWMHTLQMSNDLYVPCSTEVA